MQQIRMYVLQPCKLRDYSCSATQSYSSAFNHLKSSFGFLCKMHTHVELSMPMYTTMKISIARQILGILTMLQPGMWPNLNHTAPKLSTSLRLIILFSVIFQNLNCHVYSTYIFCIWLFGAFVQIPKISLFVGKKVYLIYVNICAVKCQYDVKILSPRLSMYLHYLTSICYYK